MGACSDLNLVLLTQASSQRKFSQRSTDLGSALPSLSSAAQTLPNAGPQGASLRPRNPNWERAEVSSDLFQLDSVEVLSSLKTSCYLLLPFLFLLLSGSSAKCNRQLASKYVKAENR